MKKALLFGLALGMMSACPSQASKLVTFDDLSGGGGSISDGYQGAHWTNFFYLNGAAQANSGFKAGVISSPNIALSGGATPAFLGADELGSGYFTAAWRDGLQLEVIGFAAGTPVAGYDHTFTLNSTNATLLTFNYSHVDTVEFISSGGTKNPNYSGDGTQFVVDNLVVPEPTTTMILLALGACALRVGRRNRAARWA